MIKTIDYVFRVLSIGAALILIPGAWWNVLTPAFWAPSIAIISCLVYAIVPRRFASTSTMLRWGSLSIIFMSLILPAESIFLNLKSKYAEPNWLQATIELLFTISMVCLFFFTTRRENAQTSQNQ